MYVNGADVPEIPKFPPPLHPDSMIEIKRSD